MVGRRHIDDAAGTDEILGLLDLVTHLRLVEAAGALLLSGAARVIGFSSTYARESLARLFYTESYDPGRGGLYDSRETRHVVDGLRIGRPRTLQRECGVDSDGADLLYYGTIRPAEDCDVIE